MIAQAIDRILSLNYSHTIEIDGMEYSNQHLKPVLPPEPEPLEVSTLTAVKEYINSQIDAGGKNSVFVHIERHNRVVVLSDLVNPFKLRYCYMVAECPDMQFPTGTQLPTEEFIPMVQSMFADYGGDKDALLKSAGNVVAEASIEIADDGVSQQTQAKSGVARRADVILPSTVTLHPFCTFPEIGQPERKFVFRMKRDQNVIACRLIPADGQTWQTAAKRDIANFLSEWLPATDIIW